MTPTELGELARYKRRARVQQARRRAPEARTDAPRVMVLAALVKGGNVKRIILPSSALLIFLSSSCSTYMPQRYTISADNNVALKALGESSINVGTFHGPAGFDRSCRAGGPISPPDEMSFEAYIRKALIDELKVAGMFDDRTPRITLTGVVEQLSFSSTRSVTGGTWDIGLRVTSSNGKSTFVTEHYEFKSGFDATTACKQTAEAFLPAVQDLIGKLVKSPEFRGMIGADSQIDTLDTSAR